MTVNVDHTQATNFIQLIGLTVSRFENGTCISEMQLRKHHLSLSGRAHGGVLASMLDTTLGVAVYSALPEGKSCATLSFNVSFFRPVAGGRLTCTSRVGNVTRQTAYASGEIHDENGRLIASATGTFFVMPSSIDLPKRFVP